MLIPLLCYCYSNYHEQQQGESARTEVGGPLPPSRDDMVENQSRLIRHSQNHLDELVEEKKDDFIVQSNASLSVREQHRCCDTSYVQEEDHDGKVTTTILSQEAKGGVEIVSAVVAREEAEAHSSDAAGDHDDVNRISLSSLMGQQQQHQGLVCLQFVVSGEAQKSRENHFLGAEYPYPKYDTRYQARLDQKAGSRRVPPPEANETFGGPLFNDVVLAPHHERRNKAKRSSPLQAWV